MITKSYHKKKNKQKIELKKEEFLNNLVKLNK